MGYRVEYRPVKKIRDIEKRVSRTAALTGVCLLLFFFLVGCFWGEGEAFVKRVFLPGNPVVTAAALKELTEDIQTGVEISEAVKGFCIRILEGAELAAVR